MINKPFLVELAELLSSRIAGWRLPKHRWLQLFLPTPGNVLFTLLVLGSLLWAQSVGAVSLAAPAVNSSLTIPYQGRLANASGTPFTGNQNMEFRLYNAPSGGTPLWSELWTGGNSVTVNDGLFSVLLGSLTAGLPAVVQSNGQLWLGITVGTDGEMSPRVQLGSAAYSMQALTVPDGSVTKAKLADGSVSSSKLAAESMTIRGDLAVSGATDGRNISFSGSGNGIVFRDDGSRSLHLLPWGGPSERWDEVCIGCGSAANLALKGNLSLTGKFNNGYPLPGQRGDRRVYWGNIVVTTVNGVARINYEQPFTTGTEVVVATNGDANAGTFTVNTVGQDKNGFSVKLVSEGGALRNGSSRIHYMAVGD